MKDIPTFTSPFASITQDPIGFGHACAHELGAENVPQHGAQKRALQFRLGRLAAQRGFESLGRSAPAAIAKAETGEPIWPTGISGSISHCREFAVAAIASTQQQHTQGSILGIGIDLERFDQTRRLAVYQRSMTSDEKSFIERLVQAGKQQEALRRGLEIFSLKESLYKALYPLAKHAGVEPPHYQDVQCLPQADEHHSAQYRLVLARAFPPFELGETVEGWLKRYGTQQDSFVLSGVVLNRKYVDRSSKS